jgi:hypothetical protein
MHFADSPSFLISHSNYRASEHKHVRNSSDNKGLCALAIASQGSENTQEMTESGE